MAERKTFNLLPQHFRTDVNEKFLNSTLDQLVSPGKLETINGFIGRRDVVNFNQNDEYIKESSNDRTHYQLEPAVVIQNEDNLEYDFATTYIDIVNSISQRGINNDNHDKLFSSDYYVWSPNIDYDKIINYTRYFWLPDGPDVVEISENISNIDLKILGQKNYTTVDGIVFTNGLKIKFTGIVTPSKYQNIEYYVEGVGKAIQLVPVEKITETEPNYITIQRGCIDRNPWSINNRWFHEDVLIQTAKYNADTPKIDSAGIGKRPIIEFNRDLKLFNFGKKYIGEIDYVNDSETDVMSNIEHNELSNLSLENVQEGETIMFVGDTDSKELVNGKIYTIQIDRIGTTDYINLSENKDYSLNEGDSLFVKSSQQQWHLENGKWKQGQAKTSANDAPLFDIFDDEGISFGDYNDSTFDGSKLFSYSTTERGPKDVVLGFPIQYRNIQNIGDIVFNDDLNTGRFEYIDSNGDTQTKRLATGVCQINGSDVTSYNWSTSIGESRQFIQQNIFVEQESNTFRINHTPISEDKQRNIIVIVNGRFKTYGYDYTLENNQLIFNENIPTNTVIVVKVYSRDKITNDSDFYTTPINLNNNPLNDFSISNTFTLGQIRNHIQSCVENNREFTGDFIGINNLRDIHGVEQYGTLIIQNSASLAKAGYMLNNGNYCLFRALEFAANEYDRFKKTFLKEVETIGNLPSGELLTAVLTKMTEFRSPSDPFYDSDMIPFDENTITSNEFIVVDIDNRLYDLSKFYSDSEYSNRGILIYHNGEMLLKDRDYTFSKQAAQFIISDDVDLTITDKLLVVEYESTLGNYIPSTPTKLGLYPKFIPSKYIDNTYETPVEVIQGHDGSITPAFGDYRDDVLLEFEKRIYNNLKVTHDPDLINIENIISSKSHKTQFTSVEVNAILLNEFTKWVQLNNIDYQTHNYFTDDNSFTWNYKELTIDNEKLPGYWRGIYRYYYGTDRPHTNPWEMLGFTIKPDWWEKNYGPAPYTSNNTVLWRDLQNGKIVEGDRTGTYNIYKRTNLLTNCIPVDEQGNLLSPMDCGIVDRQPLNRQRNFSFGDGGPAETAWRRSSLFPFATQMVLAAAKPAKYFELMFDVNAITRNNHKQIIDKDTGVFKDPRKTDIESIGYINIIKDHIKYVGGNFQSIYDNVSNLNLSLAYKLAGYSDKEKMNIVLEQISPSKESNDIFLSTDDYNLHVHTSSPLSKIIYSGIIVEKTAYGYRINGYNRSNPYFLVNNSIASVNKRIVQVGGYNTDFVNYTLGESYGQGIILKKGDTYYSVLSSFTADGISEEPLQPLAELPKRGGITVTHYSDYKKRVDQVNYGTEFATVQEVYDFIISYGRYLELSGFRFENISNGYSDIEDWNTVAREFLFWTLHKFSIGSMITVSAAANKITIDLEKAQVGKTSCEYIPSSILDQNNRIIPLKDLFYKRIDNTFELSANNIGIYGLEINPVQTEHLLILKNKTVFNDVIWDQLTGSRQNRMKLVGYKTENWDGTQQLPGYVLLDNTVPEWDNTKSYNIGDIVRYRNRFYASNISHTENDLVRVGQFDYTKWKQLEEVKSGIIPNLDSKADSFRGFYEIEEDGRHLDTRNLANNLIGFQRRKYMDNLQLDEIAQMKFYQGFIQQKGTTSIIDKLLRARLPSVNGELRMFEEWAFRVGEYGSTESNQIIEFPLVEGQFTENPEIVEFINDSESYADNKIQYKSEDLYRIPSYPSNFDKNVFKTEENIKQRDSLPSAGYVNPNEVNYSVLKLEHWVSVNKVLIEDINVDSLIVGRTQYTTPEGISLYNGMVLEFDGDVPEKYLGKQWVVSGVDQSIELTEKIKYLNNIQIGDRIWEAITPAPLPDFSELQNHWNVFRINNTYNDPLTVRKDDNDNLVITFKNKVSDYRYGDHIVLRKLKTENEQNLSNVYKIVSHPNILITVSTNGNGTGAKIENFVINGNGEITDVTWNHGIGAYDDKGYAPGDQLFFELGDSSGAYTLTKNDVGIVEGIINDLTGLQITTIGKFTESRKPSVTDDGDGVDASIDSITVNENGEITEVIWSDPGHGYSVDDILTFEDGGVTGTHTLTDNDINSIDNLTNKSIDFGSTITIDDDGDGVDASISSIKVNQSGQIVDVIWNEHGSGYSSGDTLSFTDGTNTGTYILTDRDHSAGVLNDLINKLIDFGSAITVSGGSPSTPATILSITFDVTDPDDKTITNVEWGHHGDGYASGNTLSFTDGTDTGTYDLVAGEIDVLNNLSNTITPIGQFTSTDIPTVTTNRDGINASVASIMTNTNGQITNVIWNNAGQDYKVGDELTFTEGGVSSTYTLTGPDIGVIYTNNDGSLVDLVNKTISMNTTTRVSGGYGTGAIVNSLKIEESGNITRVEWEDFGVDYLTNDELTFTVGGISGTYTVISSDHNSQGILNNLDPVSIQLNVKELTLEINETNINDEVTILNDAEFLELQSVRFLTLDDTIDDDFSANEKVWIENHNEKWAVFETSEFSGLLGSPPTNPIIVTTDGSGTGATVASPALTNGRLSSVPWIPEIDTEEYTTGDILTFTQDNVIGKYRITESDYIDDGNLFDFTEKSIDLNGPITISSAGSETGATIASITVDNAGNITTITLDDKGDGYNVGSVITIHQGDIDYGPYTLTLQDNIHWNGTGIIFPSITYEPITLVTEGSGIDASITEFILNADGQITDVIWDNNGSGYSAGDVFTFVQNEVSGYYTLIRDDYVHGRLVDLSNISIQGWKAIRVQEPIVDIDLIDRAFVYNKESSRFLYNVDFIDPLSGKISGVADQEINFKTIYDPAVYNVVNNENVTYDSDAPWGPSQVGTVWWDLTNTKYVDYHSGGSSFRKQYWGKLFPGTEINVYEWIESDSPPSQYVEFGGSGVPKFGNNTAYVTFTRTSPITGNEDRIYYYWVKDKISTPEVSTTYLDETNNIRFTTRGNSIQLKGFIPAATRKLPISTIATIIKNPKSYGLRYIGFASANSIVGVNLQNRLNDDHIVMSIKYNVVQNPTPLYTEWDLLQEGNPDSKPNPYLITKLADSLVGETINGNSVPAANIQVAETYGIQANPRQTMFTNRKSARKLLVDFCNNVFARNKIALEKKLNILNSRHNPPTGNIDDTVNNYRELSFIDTAPLPNNYTVVVLQDETYDHFWSVYEWITNEWLRDENRIQKYDTNRYWEFKDWYKTGYNSETKIDEKLDYHYELSNATANIIRVGTDDDWTLHKRNENDYDLVGQKDATIFLKNNIITDDVVHEIHYIIRALNKEIFIDDLSIEFNNLWFTFIRYILQEQLNTDWIFKTSFISIDHNVRGLTQLTNYVHNVEDNIRDYVEEAKPYRTNIREYLYTYNYNEHMRGHTTDFDPPIFYDSNFRKTRAISDHNSREIITDVPNVAEWKDWSDNFRHDLDSILVTNQEGLYAYIGAADSYDSTGYDTIPYNADEVVPVKVSDIIVDAYDVAGYDVGKYDSLEEIEQTPTVAIESGAQWGVRGSYTGNYYFTGVSGTSTGVAVVKIPEYIPNTMWYYGTEVSGMGGKINIEDGDPNNPDSRDFEVSVNGRNRFNIDGEEQKELTLKRGGTYQFKQRDSSNRNIHLCLSEIYDGIHSDGYGTVGKIIIGPRDEDDRDSLKEVKGIEIIKNGRGYLTAPIARIFNSNGPLPGLTVYPYMSNSFISSDDNFDISRDPSINSQKIRGIHTVIKFDRVGCEPNAAVTGYSRYYGERDRNGNVRTDEIPFDNNIESNEAANVLTHLDRIKLKYPGGQKGITDQDTNVSNLDWKGDKTNNLSYEAVLDLYGCGYKGNIISGGDFNSDSDNILSGGDFSETGGIDDDALIVDGGSFVQPEASGVPEDHIPGEVFESLRITVYQTNSLDGISNDASDVIKQGKRLDVSLTTHYFNPKTKSYQNLPYDKSDPNNTAGTSSIIEGDEPNISNSYSIESIGNASSKFQIRLNGKVIANQDNLDGSTTNVIIPNSIIIGRDDWVTAHRIEDTDKPGFGFSTWTDLTWKPPVKIDSTTEILDANDETYHITPTTYYRLSDNSSTTLSQDLKITDTEIQVTNGSKLFDPSPEKNLPGVIFINGERIEYFEKNGNTLSRIRRGTYGTGIASDDIEHNEDSGISDFISSKVSKSVNIKVSAGTKDYDIPKFIYYPDSQIYEIRVNGEIKAYELTTSSTRIKMTDPSFDIESDDQIILYYYEYTKIYPADTGNRITKIMNNLNQEITWKSGGEGLLESDTIPARFIKEESLTF